LSGVKPFGKPSWKPQSFRSSQPSSKRKPSSVTFRFATSSSPKARITPRAPASSNFVNQPRSYQEL